MLSKNDVSTFHVLTSDEMWLWHRGSSVKVRCHNIHSFLSHNDGLLSLETVSTGRLKYYSEPVIYKHQNVHIQHTTKERNLNFEHRGDYQSQMLQLEINF